MALSIPKIGLGTWNLRDAACTRVVEEAWELGYRHIDTAYAYENHKAIAKALKGKVRSELFLTSKLAIGQVTQDLILEQVDDTHIMETVEGALDDCLRELQTDYLDLYLIHWPNQSHPLSAVYFAMTKLIEKGKLRYAGVSNFGAHHLQDLYDAGLSVSFNQVELHPYLAQNALRKFCEKHQTELIAYRPFGKGELLHAESLFTEIGKERGITPAQVILAWILAKGHPVIPKSSSRDRLKENLDAEKILLTPQEIEKLDTLDRNQRFCNPEWSEFEY